MGVTAAIREGCTWRQVWEELGPERMGRVAARFYDELDGPTAPLVFEPCATLAIGAPMGAEFELAARPSAVAPRLSTVPPARARRSAPQAFYYIVGEHPSTTKFSATR